METFGLTVAHFRPPHGGNHPSRFQTVNICFRDACGETALRGFQQLKSFFVFVLPQIGGKGTINR